MTHITSRSNDNIKLFRKLSASKREREKNRLFTLEGVRLIADAAESGAAVRSVFVTEKCLEKYSRVISPVVNETKSKAFIISEETAEYLSETEHCQGIFAVSDIPEEKPLSETVFAGGRYIVLCEIQDPGNMGTIIRTADAVGIDGLICCGCCDIYSPKTIRSAMGSVLHLDISVTDSSAAFDAFERAAVDTYAAVVREYEHPITECDFSKGGAVFIGNEGSGLPSVISARCGSRITVPMKGRANSLNAAMAAGIIMWELTAGKSERRGDVKIGN